MFDEVTNIMHPNSEGQQTLENIAVAGASAIQRLISDRDSLRARLNAQQGNLRNLTTANDELRRCIIAIRHHYIELATKVLAQLEEFDQTTRDLMQEKPKDEDANLVSLAYRLKPAVARPTSATKFDE